MAKTITQLPPASTVTATTVLPADNAAATATEKVTVAQIVGLAPVQAVAGRTGNVALAVADIGGLQTVLDGKATAGAHGSTHSAGGTDAATLCDTFIFTRSSAPASASGSNGSYQWSVPATAKFITLDCTGGGGGGGSGRRGAVGTVRGGGGGGGGGGRTVYTFPLLELSDRALTIAVGAGGAGGAAVTANDTNGAAGTAGGPSSVRVTADTNAILCYANNATSGGGGTTAGGAAGGPNWSSTYDGSSGGAGGSGVAGANAAWARQAAIGGGGGGGISAADAAFAGGGSFSLQIVRGTITTPTIAGGAINANGANGTALVPGGDGAGGGGGGASITTAAGAGGNGSAYGGGGGGGGASLNGFNSGAGGNGGDGVVRITVWY